MLQKMFWGFSMAMADSVPGVSGSTVAFLLGFYDKFIGSVHALLKGPGDARKRGALFLCKLGLGWVAGMAICTVLLSGLFETHIYELSSAFLGLSMVAIPLLLRQEWNAFRGNYPYFIFTLLGFGVVFLMTYLRPLRLQGLNAAQPTPGLLLYIFIAGMLAISAMVLPGISGSTMLLILGVYVAILHSLKGLLLFRLEYLPVLLAFGFGVLTGLVCVIKGVHYCLQKHRSPMMFLILGLLLGSLFAIIMGPASISTGGQPLNIHNFSLPGFCAGVVVLLALEMAGKRKLSDTARKELTRTEQKLHTHREA